MFSDPMETERQQLYWAVLRDQCTIDEWEYACVEAMGRETFHKVPLPAKLLEYVEEHRDRVDKLVRIEMNRAWETRRLVEEAERIAESGNAWSQGYHAERMAEHQQKEAEYQEWLSRQPPSIIHAAKTAKLRPTKLVL